LAARTRSSSGTRLPNGSAAAAVVVGVLSVVTMPLAIAATDRSSELELLDAAFAIPLGVALGVLAVALARRGRLRIERTLGRAGGARLARLGRVLGIAGFCLAVTAALSVGVYGLLTVVAES
jgi:hypothetical protein